MNLINILGFQTLEFLVSVGGDINSRDKEGNTPLHVAGEAKVCSSELVDTLLKHGAHLDETNELKETFLDIAGSSLQPKLNQVPYVSLKCLAARVISQHKIEYKGIIPASLEPFVQLH